MIGRATVDSKAKIHFLRESISRLYLKMIELKGNVRDFNQHVSELKAGLAGRGEEVSELITHLFKAYEYVPDQQFNRYIEGIRDRYDADIEDRTADDLMILAVNKYDLLEQRNAMPSDNMDKIEALQATTAKTTNANVSTRERRANRNRVDDAWKKIPPLAHEETKKVVNGKTYHYCIHHKAWCIHTLDQCDIANKESSGNTPTTAPPPAAADRLVINRAYAAILHDDSEDDS
jgi:hypothetical protein